MSVELLQLNKQHVKEMSSPTKKVESSEERLARAARRRLVKEAPAVKEPLPLGGTSEVT